MKKAGESRLFDSGTSRPLNSSARARQALLASRDFRSLACVMTRLRPALFAA